jgi:hypothetical protein
MCTVGTAAAADQRPQIVFGAGVNALQHHGPNVSRTNGIVSAEYRFGREYFYVSPLVGASMTTDGDFYGHVGLYHDFQLGTNWFLTPHLSVGGYARGSGNNLGSALEFQSGLDLFYRMANDWRIGATIRHLSNAGIGNFNPGTELFMVLLSMPIR